MAEVFVTPRIIYTGAGALERAAASITAMGKKALIVTDPMMVKLGNLAILENILDEEEASRSVFSGVTGEPDDRMVEAALRIFREQDCDYLIALGGGSCIDTMKAVSVLVISGGKIADCMGKPIESETVPMAAIPTTAGTGSEATQVTIITDTSSKVKMMLFGRCLIPDIAVADPRFTLTAPPGVTAATGLDALCHALEAYTSRKAQPLSDTFALSAVKRILANLSVCYHEGANEKARTEMSIAALEAGIAFTNSSVTVIHGMSRPIGALFHMPHGMSNAVLLPVCLPFILEGAAGRMAVLARETGIASPGEGDRSAAFKLAEKILELTTELGIPTLEEYGVNRALFFENIDKMAKDALESGSPQNTMRVPSKEDLCALYAALWPDDPEQGETAQ